MKCRFCKTNLEAPVFDLGYTAIANNLLTPEQLVLGEGIYPLLLYFCPECCLVQTLDMADSREIFHSEYVYFSSYSKFWVRHAKEFVEKITKKLSLDENSFVVEVASNDGYLLQNFVQNGVPCIGVEPTNSTAMVAIKKGIPTIVDFFGNVLARQIVEDGKQADLIIANNVIAHVPDLNDFVSALKVVLKPRGTITIEFPHVVNLVDNCEFDTIYHEHFSYFSLTSLQKIFTTHGLVIYNVEKLATHGGSLRIYAAHAESGLEVMRSVLDILHDEAAKNVEKIDYYRSLAKNAYNIKLDFLDFLVRAKRNNKTVIGFGAAAKGNTFLNYCGVRSDMIDCVIDETPQKIGKLLPQSHIPVYKFEKIKELKPDYVVILPWNHKEEIVEKINFVKEWGGKLVTSIPSLKIID